MKLSWNIKTTTLENKFNISSESPEMTVELFCLSVQLIGAKILQVVHIILQSLYERSWVLLTPVNEKNKMTTDEEQRVIFKNWCNAEAQWQKVCSHLISLRSAPSWLWICSLASICSSRSLWSFFLAFSRRSIASSASSICLFAVFSLWVSCKVHKSEILNHESGLLLSEYFLFYVWIKMSTWSLWVCRLTFSSSACIFISFTLRSSLRLACCRLLLSLRAKAPRDHITAAAASCNSTPSWCVWTLWDTLTLTTVGKVIWVGSVLDSYHQVSDGTIMQSVILHHQIHNTLYTLYEC